MGADNYSTSLKEWRVLPRLTRSGINPDLKTTIAKGVTLNIPLMSAAMQSVTGERLAIWLAKIGGIGVIHSNQPVSEQAKMVKTVKNYKAGFVETPLTVKPSTTLIELLDLFKRYNFSVYPITDDGSPNSKYIGVAFSEDFRMSKEQGLTALDFKKDIATHEGRISLNDAKDKLRQLKQKCLPLLEGDKLKSVVFRKDILDESGYPNQLVDKNERLMVAAAINTHDHEKRVPELVKAGVDLLVVDASQGYSEYQLATIKYVKKNFSVPIVGGNIITKEGFEFMVNAGVDAVKVGMGGGSICITQEVKRIGRGQATAIMDVAEARKEMKVETPIISDGGIVTDGDIFIALALGSDAVMMGRYFAGFEESPTRVIQLKGNKVKPYWGEGSLRARNNYRYENFEPDNFVIEGVEGYVPYAGLLEEGVKKTINTVTHAMKTAGCYSVKELHNARKEYISMGSRIEGDVHDIIM